MIKWTRRTKREEEVRESMETQIKKDENFGRKDWQHRVTWRLCDNSC